MGTSINQGRHCDPGAEVPEPQSAAVRSAVAVGGQVNHEQPPPTPGSAPATWDLVIEDIRDRDRIGARKYGVRHQHDNGRDHLIDAYQEALDLVVYLRAEIERRRG